MNIELDLLQTSALAMLLLGVGEAARRRIGVLRRFAFPGPVIGGFLFALLSLTLRQTGVAEVSFDTTLQSPAMIAFFSTIGLAGSFTLLRKGGKLLLVYLAACWTLAIMQNLVGMGVAQAMGIDPMFGIMAGSVSLEGGHGAAAAFGPTAEEMGTEGATAVAIASATFGLVAGGLIGGPIAGWLIDRHRIAVPERVKALAAVPAGGRAIDVEAGRPSGASSGGAAGDGDPSTADGEQTYRSLLTAILVIAGIMVIGTQLGSWFSTATGFSLPGYVGAMVVAVAFRNLNDRFRLVRLDEGAVSLISNFTLGFFLTMAMMSLKIWELSSLALPLIAILAAQVAFIVVFAVFVVFRLLGRDYDAATMVGGFLGHGLGGTPNAMANMDAVNKRFGVRSERAFLIVPLAGAVLIDVVALPWIVFCMNWVG